MSTIVWIVASLSLVLFGMWALLLWATRWGATSEERSCRLPGDDYLEGGPPERVAMTRAVSIRSAPAHVWPWISQLGRGAGWYSVDWLDNGRKTSARHIVSWIPEPRPGDATAIGYLRHLDEGRCVAWWVDGTNFFGARARLVTCYSLRSDGQGTRLVSRMSADASGPTASIALLVFRIIDSIMACRQLIGIRERAERNERTLAPVEDPESAERDQYQLYEVLYAGGDRAGVAGKENAETWRQAAIRDGAIKPD